MIELKPCPFCGGEAECISSLETAPIVDLNGYFIKTDKVYHEETHCRACGIGYELKNGEPKETTMEKWNRRSLKDDIEAIINALPSANKSGHWIHDTHYGLNLPEHKCSECGTWEYSDEESNFCPHCGADMRGED